MTTSHVHSPAELLAAIPHLLGFTPHESIVVIGVNRTRHVGLIMRVDRADCLIPEVARELGQSVGAHLERDGAAFALLVAYSDGALTTPCDALSQVAPWIDDYVPVRDEWRVSQGRYRSSACTDLACCPAAGMPMLPAPPEPHISALRASLSHQSQDHDLVPWVASDARRRAARARDRAWKARDRDPRAWAVETLELWRESVSQALDGRTPTDAQCGRLLAGLRDVRVRDALIIDLDVRFASAADQLAKGNESELARDAIRGLLARPARSDDAARAEAAAELAAVLAAYASGQRRDNGSAAPLTVAALARKWRGEEMAAQALIRRALAADPHYSLALLVESAFELGVAIW